MHYFEDFEPGQIYECGSHTITEDEIVRFASEFDPQYFHLDREKATQSIYGGLIASGWHTICLMNRLIVGRLIDDPTAMGSPGIDEIRWRLPVRPGDTLSARVRVLETRRSRTKPDRGLVKTHNELLNDDQQVVVHAQAVAFYRCREPTTS